MQKIILYTVAIIFCLTSFHSSLAHENGMLRQNDSPISVDETRRTEADNMEVVGRDVQPDPLLARFLWRDASPTPSASPNRSELQWSEQGTLAPDQLLARFLWQDEPAKQDADNTDVVLSTDAQPQLARFLWRDASPTPSASPNRSELQWSEQGTLAPDQLLARFLWQDEPANKDADSAERINTFVDEDRNDYIVSGKDLSAMNRVMEQLDIEVTHELTLINSLAVSLTAEQTKLLKENDEVGNLFASTPLKTANVRPVRQGASDNSPSIRNSDGREIFVDTDYPKLVRADQLHKQGIKGASVGIAIIDTGLWGSNFLNKDSTNAPRINAYYDAISDYELDPYYTGQFEDPHGHGTHIASIIGNSAPVRNSDGSPGGGSYSGIAPDSELTIIRAFDSEGKGTYADVVRAISFAVENKDRLNIDVINMSFGGQPRSHYWDDPINQAVMAAWDAGIVVIASAGNLGPDPMSVTVPGNNPYVVTVGAMTDSYTPDDPSDDKLASFSGVGPTLEGHVKPEVISPGGHIRGLMQSDTTLAEAHPEFHDGGDFFIMSGTSQSAAVVSGIAALIISQNDGISPDDVKCKLMSSALSATVDGENVYSVFQQGAGLVDAVNAVESDASGCANAGLDIAKDLSGEEHYGGPATMNESGEFAFWSNEDYDAIPSEHLLDADGFLWQYSDFENQGFLWQYGFIWQYSDIENQGFLWQYSSPENQGFLWQYSDFETNGLNWDIDSLVQNGLVGNLGEGMQDSGFLWQYGSPEIARWVKQE
jgi:serine protease AprX